MLIAARVENEHGRHAVSVATDGVPRPLEIAPRASGFGSSANGGELLCAAIATCYCNDVSREAAKRNVTIVRVEVEVEAEFGAVGQPASRLSYSARVEARAPEAEIAALMAHVDRVAEIQNTLRRGMEVRFERASAVTVA